MKNLLSLIFLIFFLNSCNYSRDKLVVKNRSNHNINITTLTKDMNDGKYYEISGGCEIESKKSNSPIIRTEISYELSKQNTDKNLYIIYSNLADINYINDNMNYVIESKKFKVDKYSLKELDSMNWVVSYPRNAKIK